MKKTFKSLLVALLVLLAVAALTLVACDQTPDDAPHQHTFSSRWSSNDVEHWHAATCGHDETADLAAHDYGTDNVCDTCGYTKAPSGSDDPGSQGGGSQGSQGDDPAPNTVTVTFAINYSGGTNPSARTVAQGSSVILPGASRTGYAFDGWYTESSGGTLVGKEGASYVAKASVTLYAHWTADQQGGGQGGSDDPGSQGGGGSQGDDPAPNTVTVTFAINYSGGTNPSARTVAQGSSVILPGASRTGYAFDGWYTESSGGTLVGKEGASYVAKASVTLYAHWTADQQGGGQGGSDDPGSQGGGGSQGDDPAPNTVTVTFAINYSGGTNPSARTVAQGSSVILPGASRTGYAFDGWYTESSGGTLVGKEGASYVAKASVTLYAHWTANQQGGSGSQGGGSQGGNDTPSDTSQFDFEPCDGGYSIRADSVIDPNITIPSIYNGQPVVSIGDYAFDNCWKLTSITIPSTVTSIGDYAFLDCYDLQTVTFEGDSQLQSIGDYAFDNCWKLTSITIPSTVTSIGERAFSGCSALQTVIFAGDSQLQSIGGWAFYGCSSLTEITIPSTVTSIFAESFRGCSNLQTVTFEGDSQLQSIGGWAFYGCSSLTEITIPNNVTSIYDSAFSGCTNLTTVNWNATNCTSVGKFGYSSLDHEYYDNTPFKGCKSLATVTVGANVKFIPSDTFYFCTSLNTVNITNIDAWCNIDFEASNANPLYYAGNLYLNGYLAVSVTIPTEITQIKPYIFYGCTSLQEVTIPENVTSIGDNAFFGCNNLHKVNILDFAAWYNIDFSNGYSNPLSNRAEIYYEGSPVVNVTIPTEITQIKPYIFRGCTSLQEITISEQVTSIGNNAFAGCSNLTTVNWNATNCTSVGKYGDNDYTIFTGCKHLTMVNIGNNVINIPAYAFYNECGSLRWQEITIPANVTCIGEKAFSHGNITFADGCQLDSISAFYGLKGLQSLNNIPAKVTSIGYNAFVGCSNLIAVTFADGSLLKSIGIGAFMNCTRLQEITIPASVTSINVDTFYGCSNLTTVTFAEGSLLKNIGIEAFKDCTRLQEITIPACVTSIYAGAFVSCSNLATVTFAEDSQLNNIYNDAFYDCSQLTSITIPSTVTSIGQYAFWDCNNLKTVYYGGSQTQWKTIRIDNTNYVLRDATTYYYSADKPDGSELPVSSYWHWVNGKPTVWKEEDQLNLCKQ